MQPTQKTPTLAFAFVHQDVDTFTGCVEKCNSNDDSVFKCLESFAAACWRRGTRESKQRFNLSNLSSVFKMTDTKFDHCAITRRRSAQTRYDCMFEACWERLILRPTHFCVLSLLNLCQTHGSVRALRALAQCVFRANLPLRECNVLQSLYSAISNGFLLCFRILFRIWLHCSTVKEVKEDMTSVVSSCIVKCPQKTLQICHLIQHALHFTRVEIAHELISIISIPISLAAIVDLFVAACTAGDSLVLARLLALPEAREFQDLQNLHFMKKSFCNAFSEAIRHTHKKHTATAPSKLVKLLCAFVASREESEQNAFLSSLRFETLTSFCKNGDGVFALKTLFQFVSPSAIPGLYHCLSIAVSHQNIGVIRLLINVVHIPQNSGYLLSCIDCDALLTGNVDVVNAWMNDSNEAAQRMCLNAAELSCFRKKHNVKSQRFFHVLRNCVLSRLCCDINVLRKTILKSIERTESPVFTRFFLDVWTTVVKKSHESTDKLKLNVTAAFLFACAKPHPYTHSGVQIASTLLAASRQCSCVVLNISEHNNAALRILCWHPTSSSTLHEEKHRHEKLALVRAIVQDDAWKRVCDTPVAEMLKVPEDIPEDVPNVPDILDIPVASAHVLWPLLQRRGSLFTLLDSAHASSCLLLPFWPAKEKATDSDIE